MSGRAMVFGASIFSGDAAQGQPGFDDNVVTLWEAHGTWTPGKFEFAALYANGHISNTSKVNLTFIGNPTLIPESFYGWYGQAAYDLLNWDGNSLRPFVRFERLNTASNYSDIAPGLTPENGPDQDIITSGFSTSFPKGMMVGYVVEVIAEKSTNNYLIKLRSAANFYNIEFVYAIDNKQADEINKIQEKAKKQTQ